MSPTGKSGNKGTRRSPWDLPSVIDGSRRVAPGTTVWLLGGIYRKSPNPEGLGYRCMISGTADRPIVFRAAPGERVTLDGGWSYFGSGGHVWLWGVEIRVTEPMPHGSSGSWPPGAPNGGFNVYSGKGVKGINLVLHHNRQGASLWTEAKDCELYGCVIYDNGWVGTDRAHGHAVYVQNPAGSTKWITDNIFTARESRGWRDGRYTVHCYGERVSLTNIEARGNFQYGQNDAWLMGTGATPTEWHRLIENVIVGIRVRVGGEGKRAEIRDNVLARCQLELGQWGTLVKEGNTISPPDPKPSAATAHLRPNRYEPNRAHLMVVDWEGRRRVTLDLGRFLRPGDRYRLLDPTDQHGPPLAAGVAGSSVTVSVPVRDGAEAFVVVKDPAPTTRLAE